MIQSSTSCGRGSPGYRAPEMFSEESFYTPSSDIWAVGFVYYELRTKQKLFKTDFEISDWAKSNNETKLLPDDPSILETWEDEQAFLAQMVHRN